MTPSMRLAKLKGKFNPNAQYIYDALDEAYALGHEFGIERAAEIVDQCNHEGPYNAVGAALRIRALKVERINPACTVDQDFPIDRFIVAELSKNWTSEGPVTPELLAEKFEQSINFNDNRGYELRSWRLHRMTDSVGSLNETIIAVFEKKKDA